MTALRARACVLIGDHAGRLPVPRCNDERQSSVIFRLNLQGLIEFSRAKADRAMQMRYVDFLKRTLIVVAAAVIPVLIWYLFGVVLMAFGAVILAMLLRLGAQPFMRRPS